MPEISPERVFNTFTRKYIGYPVKFTEGKKYLVPPIVRGAVDIHRYDNDTRIVCISCLTSRTGVPCPFCEDAPEKKRYAFEAYLIDKTFWLNKIDIKEMSHFHKRHLAEKPLVSLLACLCATQYVHPLTYSAFKGAVAYPSHLVTALPFWYEMFTDKCKELLDEVYKNGAE